jgi:hypothetical protein
MPKSMPSKSCHLRQTVPEYREHIFPQMKQQSIQRLHAEIYINVQNKLNNVNVYYYDEYM